MKGAKTISAMDSDEVEQQQLEQQIQKLQSDQQQALAAGNEERATQDQAEETADENSINELKAQQTGTPVEAGAEVEASRREQSRSDESGRTNALRQLALRPVTPEVAGSGLWLLLLQNSSSMVHFIGG